MVRIIRDILDPKEQHRHYAVSDKQPSSSSRVRRLYEEDMREIADMLESVFGRGPFTIKEAFQGLFGPQGYSYYRTSELLRDCKECGFLESTNI